MNRVGSIAVCYLAEGRIDQQRERRLNLKSHAIGKLCMDVGEKPRDGFDAP